MKLYITGDTGPSGFGVATRYLIKNLIDSDQFNITVRTHQWGMNKEGIAFEGGGLPDRRWEEYLLKNNIANEDYLIEDPREMADRQGDLLQNLGTNKEIESEKCIIRQFEDEEDVWLAVGGIPFTEHAPERPYTILSTDYNLDIVPRKWEYHINQVDEVWVPSEWTRQSILNRIGDGYSDKVKTYPYGVPMDYEPTEYDCEVCPHNSGGGANRPQRCLRDDSFNFLVISRFYHIKGIYRTVRAFIEEFRQSDDVRMFIKTTSNNQFQFNPIQSTQAIVNELKYPDPPEIGFAIEPLETQYLYDLMGHCDAFLQYSRAECFGIAQFQAAYCGTPVAYTNWSAQEELMDTDNDGLFPLNDYEVEKTNQEFRGLPYEVSGEYPPDGKWATPSIEAIREHMRELYEMDREELDHAGKKAREYVSENFKWSDAIEPRIERLKTVAGEKQVAMND